MIRRLTEKALRVLIEETWPRIACFDLPGINYEAHFQIKRVGAAYGAILGLSETRA